MKYRIVREFEVEEITCGEALNRLEYAKGDIHCLPDFIDPEYPDDVADFYNSWGWVRARHPSKKILLILEETKSEGGLISG